MPDHPPDTVTRHHHHLSDEEVERIGVELDALRQRVLEDRGARDAAYIRRTIDVQRKLELVSRLVLVLAARHRAGWVVGTSGLAVAKILDNMEIGHNVMHGQWDWMRDPRLHSTTWEWDHVSPSAHWKRAHNETHHVFTNILGQDNDLGYGIMRVDEAQSWQPKHLVQPLWNLVNALVFEYGIATFDLDLSDDSPQRSVRVREMLAKMRRQALKDYVVHPLLSGRGWRRTLTATVAAGVVRNVWAHSVIMCGHFPEGVEVFEQDALADDETRGEWYLRQMLGSADISGSPLLHLMTGNLSHQVEHHLFPDLPSNRYAEIAPEVEDLFQRNGLSYHSAPMARQLGSAWHRVVRLSFPNGWLAATHRGNLGRQLVGLARMARSGQAPQG